MEISATQARVLKEMVDGHRLFQLRGGFWTTSQTACSESGIPSWSVDIRTVRAMEAKGLLQRCRVEVAEWKDNRTLTQAGYALADSVVSGAAAPAVQSRATQQEPSQGSQGGK